MPRTERAASWLLFLVPSFIWGTTWFAIKFQLGEIAPEVSVSYRFGVAAALLFSGRNAGGEGDCEVTPLRAPPASCSPAPL